MKIASTSFIKDLIRTASLVWEADKQTTLIDIILQILQAFLPIAALYYIKEILEAVIQLDKPFESIYPLIIASGVIQLLLAMTKQYSSYVNTLHQQNLSNYLSEQVLTKAVETDYEYYENPLYHDTLHLAQQQSVYKASQLLTIFNAFLLNSISLLLLVGFFLTLHSSLALIFIFLAIPLAIIKWYSGYALLKLESKYAPMVRESNYLYQTLTGINAAKEIRVFGLGNPLISKFRNIRSIIHKEERKLNFRFTIYSLIAELLEIIVMVAIFVILAKQTWERSTTVGVFVVYLQGFPRLQTTAKSFLQAVVQIFQQRIFLKDLFAFFDIPTGNNAGKNDFPAIEEGIKISNVSFTYPQTERTILHNVSLNCPKGKIIAIVGENGSGKSTLVKLIARLYHIQTGSIKADTTEIATIELSSYRRSTNILFQDFEKFFFTAEENISLGDFGNPENLDVKKAATLSGAHSFIEKLNNGYKTRLGKSFVRSEQLSGGQWQKMALARIFYHKAQLVVLDEPTSALDATSELEVFKNIKQEFTDKVVILITHRLYNLKIADYIYVMTDGRIAEEGTFETLINTGGLFSKNYEAQKL